MLLLYHHQPQCNHPCILYLHSTMLLLYQQALAVKGLYKNIYIPLCFYFIQRLPRLCLPIQYLHSTMLLLYRFGTYLYSAPYSIYIPLCFYFIRDFQSRFPCDLIYLHSTMLLLYLLRFRLSTACSSNLHSTMLLLYRSRCSLCVDRKDIYIPLCFYFILIKFLRKLACVEFTFHYASTLSYSLRL